MAANLACRSSCCEKPNQIQSEHKTQNTTTKQANALDAIPSAGACPCAGAPPPKLPANAEPAAGVGAAAAPPKPNDAGCAKDGAAAAPNDAVGIAGDGAPAEGAPNDGVDMAGDATGALNVGAPPNAG